MKHNNTLNIILLSVGDAMYPQDALREIVARVWKGVDDLQENVIARHVLMDEDDAFRAEKELLGKKADLVIVNFVSWHITPFVMHVLRHFRDTPLLVWGNGGKRDASGKIISPAAAAGVTGIVPLLRSMGYRYKVICEKTDEELRLSEVKSYIRTVKAKKRVQNAKIGMFGYADQALFSCAYDKTLVFDKFGIDIEDYFSYELADMMASCPQEKVDAVIQDIRNDLCCENEIRKETLEKAARLYCAMKDKSDDRQLDAISIKCITGVTKYMGINPCLAQSLLANKDLSVICECDAYGLLTNVMLSALTDQASTFMENYEFFDDSVLVGICGFIPAEFVEGAVKIRACNLGQTIQGISNVSSLKNGPVTFARLYVEDGKFRMFISKGQADPHPKWTEIGWAEPTPNFPSFLLKLEIPVQTYLENVPGQHIIMVYGDWVEQLKDLCGLLDIAVDKI